MTPDLLPTPETPVAARVARPESRLFVGSEVGVLRRVLLHRPDRELKRLTPINHDDLLFDDVLWVKRATEQHKAFQQLLKSRGIEVFLEEDLLTQALHILPLFLSAHAVSLVVRMLVGGMFPGWELLLAPVFESLLWPVVSLVLLAPQRRPPDSDKNRPL